MISFIDTPIYANTTSRRTDGVTLDQGSGGTNSNRWLLGLESTGGATPGFHALLRFSTGDIVTDAKMTVVMARFRVTLAARSTLGANFKWFLWASDFATGLTTGAYNLPYNNKVLPSGAGNGTLRIPLGTLFAIGGGTLADGTVGECNVPSRYIAKGAGKVSDLEIRPLLNTGVSLTQGANINIYGTTVEVGVNRPRLVGEAYTDSELVAQNPYRFQAVGAETFFGIVQETTKGRALKATNFLDVRSVGIDATVQNIPSQALTTNRLRPFKIAVGRADAGGDCVFELTPEKWPLLLLGVLKYVGSIDVSGLYGTGNTGVYEANFRQGLTKDLKSFTCVTKRGPFRYVYPGTMISDLEITSSLDSIVTATIRLVAREEYSYDEEGAGLSDAFLVNPAAAYDTLQNAPLSYVGAQVAFSDPADSLVVDSGIIQSFTIRMRNDIQEQRGHNRKRAARSHYAQGFTVEVSLSLYFENELFVKRYMGAGPEGMPYGAEKRIQLETIQLAMAGAGGASDGSLEFLNDGQTYRQEVILTVPTAVFTAQSKPVNGEGGIILDCTAMATYDSRTQTISGLGTFENGGITAVVRNMEAGTAYTPLAETFENLITVKPRNRDM